MTARCAHVIHVHLGKGDGCRSPVAYLLAALSFELHSQARAGVGTFSASSLYVPVNGVVRLITNRGAFELPQYPMTKKDFALSLETHRPELGEVPLHLD